MALVRASEWLSAIGPVIYLAHAFGFVVIHIVAPTLRVLGASNSCV